MLDTTSSADKLVAEQGTIKVLHFICSTGFYGAEKWILALANNLDSMQIHSELAVTRESESHDLELTREFRALGLTAHEVAMSGRFDVRGIKSLVQLLRDRQIDVLHSHGYKSDILGLIAARRAGIKCITTPHGFESTEDWKLNLFIKIGNFSMRYFDSVVPLSAELCSDVTGFKVPESKVKYIRNGVDLKGVEFRLPSSVKHANEPEGTKLIGFIGQMIERKNVADLLDIFERIAGDFPAVRLVLLGDGSSRAEYQQYAAALGSSDRIEFLGFRSNPLDYLRNFDLFVMSSSLEGIPRCLMESMAMGVPVAAYDIPGIDQLIENETSGLLAPFGDIDRLEQCWRELLNDPGLADRLASAAADCINENFSAKRMADEYTVHYLETMNR